MTIDGQNRKETAKKVNQLRQAKIEKFQQLYADLGHAIQTGIAWIIALDNPDVFDINKDPNLRAHKHLRTGIDTTKSDHGALVKLLIDEGVIDEDKYFEYIIQFLIQEKESYEKELSKKLGKEVTLH